MGLKHIYSGKVHVGILDDVDSKTATLKSGNKIKQLRIANIQILPDNELYQWKLDNLNKITHSISCIFSKNVHVETIQKTVENFHNIIDINLIDAYNGPQIPDDSISLTFEVTALTKEAIDNVEKLFVGFGGTIR